MAYWPAFLGTEGGKGGRMLLMILSIMPIKFVSDALFDDTSALSVSKFWLLSKILVCFVVSEKEIYYFLVLAYLRFKRLPIMLSSYL